MAVFFRHHIETSKTKPILSLNQMDGLDTPRRARGYSTTGAFFYV
jgi:hypothetical protein